MGGGHQGEGDEGKEIEGGRRRRSRKRRRGERKRMRGVLGLGGLKGTGFFVLICLLLRFTKAPVQTGGLYVFGTGLK